MRFIIKKISSFNVGTKLALLVPLVISLVFAVPAWLISVSTTTLIEEQALAEIKTKIDGLLDMVATAVEGFKTETDYALQLFAQNFPDPFILDSSTTVDVAGRPTPVLKSGDQPINLDFSMPDAFTRQTGGVATVFVRQGDDFIRISTSLKKENGERAIGTLLDRQHPGYQQLLKGQSYHGIATLFNREYMTKYQPIQGENGAVIGVLFVGVDISAPLRTRIKDRIKALKIGETGYYYVIDAKPGKDYGRFVLHPTQEGVNLLESGNDPVAETIKQVLQKQRGVIRYSRIDVKAGETAPREKIAVFDFTSSLEWIITGSAFVDEITRAANAKSRQLAWLGFFTVVVTSLFLYLAIRHLVSKPLKIAMEAAHCLAQGELQAPLHHQRTDEIGRLLEAVREIARNLTDMATQIRETASSMHSVIEEITENHQQLTHHAEEQASALAETASTLEQLTATVKQNADHAQQADSLAAGARAQAEQGGQVVGQAVAAMTEINIASRRVADIIGVIDEIAFQTNLLALNAAVEAARAGEHGRGFAVVAGEVRKLAQRSAEAAKEIKTLIQDSVAKVAEGERFVNESGRTLNEIVLATQKVNSIVAEIASANRQQTIGIEQVSQAVAKVDGMVQQNVTLASQATASGEIVNTQAKELNELMKFFKIES